MPHQQPPMYAMRVPRIIAGTNRVGQPCQALRAKYNQVHVRFADGAEAVVSRFLLRPLPESAIVRPHPKVGF